MSDFLRITPQALQEKIEAEEEHFLLDIREVDEFELVNIGGKHIPMGDIPNHLAELPKEVPIYVLCHHGVRSAKVVIYLMSQGFDNVYNISGGIDRWQQEVDPSLVSY